MGVPLVPYEVWYRSLTEKMVIENGPTNGHVAMKFIDYFRAGVAPGIREYSESMGLLAKVNCRKAQGASESLSSDQLPMLCASDVFNWIEYWRRVEFL